MSPYLELTSRTHKKFTRPMLLRMRELYNQGLPVNAITAAVNNEFCYDLYPSNVRMEIEFMKAGMYTSAAITS